jgi:hypothetical protein
MTAKITFRPSEVQADDVYEVLGSGFTAGQFFSVAAYEPTFWSSGRVGADGTFKAQFTALHAGEIKHQAKEQGENGKLRQRATATLKVDD